MSDAMQRPDATSKPSPQEQGDESKGNVKGPQVTDHNVQETDLPAGAQGDVRRTSNGAR